ncbi:hypothetical protein GCM10010218_60870 [Streptomyces mashuensis]|uniref:Uncharacterized protein n=1 Tax=Streptomyces mashuensis TaxID=33904 RepID=A0A919B8M4_9ACTN|nr:hypothetical protein GCM10010218_60870 [Streptomyces mashuensis]
MLVYGINKIAGGWPRLAGTEFAGSLQAGCRVPTSSTDVYLFKNDRYVRYTV